VIDYAELAAVLIAEAERLEDQPGEPVESTTSVEAAS
jgi:hypothetical protein